MIRRPPRSTQSRSSAASDVYKRQGRPYCRYLCPYGPLLAWCTRLARRGVTITPDKELDCGLCADACPYGAIDQMRAVRKDCLYCARCYASCPCDGELAHAKAELVTLS